MIIRDREFSGEVLGLLYSDVRLSLLRGIGRRRLWSNSFLLLSASGLSLIFGVDSFGVNLTGTAGDDTLDGNPDDIENIISGEGGDDIISGGSGFNDLDGGAGIDTLSFAGASGGVTYVLHQFQHFADLEDVGLGLNFFVGFENLRGSDHADVLTGDGGSNRLRGGGGSDRLDGGSGDDVLIGGAGEDTLDGGADIDTVSYASDSVGVTIVLDSTGGSVGGGDGSEAAGDILIGIENLTGGSGDDSLRGNSRDNVIIGGGGDDIISGGRGNDVLAGGEGVDTLSFADIYNGITYSIGHGSVRVSSYTYRVSGFEDVIGSRYGDVLSGDSGSNVIDGGGGDDVIMASSGDDVLIGGSGNDTLSYAASGVGVVYSIGQDGPVIISGFGTDTVSGFENVIGTRYDDVLTGDSGDNELFGGGGNDVLEGGAGADTLNGGGGNDVFEGGAGADTLNGSGGYDTASYASDDTGVTIALNSWGTTVVEGVGNHASGDRLAFIENLTGGSGSDFLRGSFWDNVIIGGGGDDIISGGGGNDVLAGGEGSDTLSFADVVPAGSITYSIGVDSVVIDGFGTYMVSSFENVIGSDYGDVFTGDSGDNVIDGGGGDDVVLAGSGDDVLKGGSGNDTLSYVDSGVGVTYTLQDLSHEFVLSGFGTDTLSGFENLIGSDYDDSLRGDSGDNILSGGSGRDLLYGLGGDDIIFVGSEFNSLRGGEGVDTLSFADGTGTIGVSYVLSQDIRSANLTKAGFGFNRIGEFENVIGTGYDDVFTGDSGSNELFGGLGDDKLTGGLGSDIFVISRGIDTITDYVSGDSLSFENLSGIVDRGDFTVGISGVSSNLSLSFDGDSDSDTVNDVVIFSEIYAGLENMALLFSDINYVPEVLNGDSLVSVYENSDDVFYRVTGSDIDGDSLTYSISGGADSALFSINSVTGEVSFKVGVDSDSASDVGGDNVYDLEFDVSDGIVSISHELAVARLERDAGVSLIGNTWGNNILRGGSGNDVLESDQRDDILYGGAGNDYLEGGWGNDTLYGGSGDDTLVSSWGGDILIGGAGADIIRGSNYGQDVASYVGDIVGVTVVLKGYSGYGIGGHAEGDVLTNIENLIGGSGDDVLTGNRFANMLEGGAGGDAIDGGGGIDAASYVSDDVGVTVTLASDGSASYIGGGDAWGDRLMGIENLIGGSGDDVLTGNSGANVLEGGFGGDYLDGGSGSGIDTVIYASDTTGVKVTLANGGSASVASGGHADGDRLVSIENLIGGSGDDVLTGNSGANVLEGGAGVDRLMGGLGDDIFEGGSGDDVIDGGLGDDILEGGVGSDVINGGGGIDTASYASDTRGVTITLDSAGNANAGTKQYGHARGDTLIGIENLIGGSERDVLTGNSGDNVLEGGGGWRGDRLNGGGGTDTASYASDTLGVTITLDSDGNASGRDQIGGGDAYRDILTSIENLTGGSGDDILRGNALANVLRGGSGDDILEGGMGGDVLDGGDGNDIASFAGSDEAVIVTLASDGSAAVISGGEAVGDTLIGIEGLIGGSGNDVLRGNSVANVLEGGAGGDDIAGGEGIDTASYASDDSGVTITLDSAGSASGSVQISGGDALSDTLSGIENLTGGSGSDVLTGNSGDNVLEGGAGVDRLMGGLGDDILEGGIGDDVLNGAGGDDILEGGAGGDVLDGGADNDTVSYDKSGGVTITLADDGSASVISGSHADGDTLVSIENLIGSVRGDRLTGNSGVNILSGGGGDDILEGRGGADIIDGGAGYSDTVSYASDDVGVTITLDINGDAVGAGGHAEGDRLMGIEGFIGGSGDDVFVGNDNNNGFEGGSGSDTFTGGGGNDRVSYASDDVGVTITLDDDGNAVGVGGHAEGDRLEGIEYITGGSGDDVLMGNMYNNVLLGGAGANTLSAGSGNDVLFGGSGDDILIGGSGMDWILAGDGIDMLSYANDTVGVTVTLDTYRGEVSGGDAEGDIIRGIENVTGGSGADVLVGNSNVNVLDGGAGDDKLDGGAGDDTLTGGGGSDTFMASEGSDSIMDWGVGGSDRLSFANFGDIVDSASAVFVFSASGDNKLRVTFDSDGYSGTDTASITFANIGAVDSATAESVFDSMVSSFIDYV